MTFLSREQNYGESHSATRRRGFTLIELLIVVAIIAILAAIAVPNFLEAQVRAKVSRAKADLRSLATALESYYTDNNEYPNSWVFPGDPVFPPVVLTTPISYITSWPDDVFQLQNARPAATGPFAAFVTFSHIYPYGAMPQDIASRYVLVSMGPDTDIDTYLSTSGPGNFQPDFIALAHYPGWTPDLFSDNGVMVNAALFKYVSYDPTNGTVSSGDIYRFSDHQNQ